MKDSSVVALNSPEEVEDVLTGVLREGAMRLLKEALEIEIETFIEEYKGFRLSNGCRRIVRNGYNDARNIQTGIGEVKVRVPRAEDREALDDKIRFRSSIVPPYIRRTKSIEALLRWLYLKGISTGDFPEALEALFGKAARGLSSGTISRLKSVWWNEYEQWNKRDLSKKRYVYFWVDETCQEHCVCEFLTVFKFMLFS
ncbi:MAG: hypothetical protein D6734_05875 [Candidatus Schekmanbacteria bacterium]|nr:MAG: hypothetical protein D6734_05875 [Candidatus Schekmanbacteria bacterium]